MERLLISWIGKNDLNAVAGEQEGPILAAILAAHHLGTPYTSVHLLYNYPDHEVSLFIDWLSSKLPIKCALSFKAVKLTSPTSYPEIYVAAEELLNQLSQQHPTAQRTVHLSPGTPAMTAVWILLVKTKFPSVCIESWFEKNSKKQHVNEVSLPFDIDAQFTREAIKRSDERLTLVIQGDVKLDKAFDRIVTHGGLNEVLNKSKKMAVRSVPVLLLGETGTGKELFAQAIHDGSSRSDGPFVPVNCGALPRELAESLLFGHLKGAFTGATKDHTGYFMRADGGTLFLDEIGELSLDLQVKLLRALQEKSFLPVGANKEIKSDFRIISATHRDLIQQVSEGGFREDLFYRLAIGVIKLPALRHRTGDLPGLVDALMDQINDELADQPGYQRKKIDQKVINIISRHKWPGNIRELSATLLRAAAWSDSDTLSSEEIEDAILTVPSANDTIMVDDIHQPIDLNDLMDRVARHYIPLALTRTGGNKSRAAELLGLNSQQVLSNRMEKLGIE